MRRIEIGRGGTSIIALAMAALIWPNASAQELPPGVLLLARVKAHVRDALAHLPNYTCLQTMERFQKPAGDDPAKLVDTVRMEVLYSGGAEFYAPPGETRFQERDPTALTSYGLMATGAFAMHLKAALLNPSALLTWRGEEELNGRRAARYDFVLSSRASGLAIRGEGGSERAGMRGSIWVDPESLDVIRMEDHAYDMGANLPAVNDASTIVNYGRMRVGDQFVMLPQEGVIRLVRSSGAEDWNTFAFTHCRAFDIQSSIKFDDVPVGAPTAPRTLPAGAAEPAKLLPAGLNVAIALTAPITGKAAVGDIVEGKIAADVVKSGKVLIPKDAIARGRVRRLQRYAEAGSYFAVGLEFTAIETGAGRLQFYADLATTDRIPGLEWSVTNKRPARMEIRNSPREPANSAEREVLRLPDLPGVGSFFIRGDELLIPVGFKMVWKTRSPAQ